MTVPNEQQLGVMIWNNVQYITKLATMTDESDGGE